MIKAGYVLETDTVCAQLKVVGIDSDSVVLRINDNVFHAEDLKQLRKFLKKLQKQLEAGTVESPRAIDE